MSTRATPPSSPSFRSRSPSPTPFSVQHRHQFCGTSFVSLIITTLLLLNSYILFSALYLLTNSLLPSQLVTSSILAVFAAVLALLYCLLHGLTCYRLRWALPATSRPSSISNGMSQDEKAAVEDDEAKQSVALHATASVVGRLLLLVSLGATITGITCALKDPLCKIPGNNIERVGCILHRSSVASAASTLVLGLTLILILEIGRSPSTTRSAPSSSAFPLSSYSPASYAHPHQRSTSYTGDKRASYTPSTVAQSVKTNETTSPRSSQAARYSFRFTLKSSLSHLHLRRATESHASSPCPASTGAVVNSTTTTTTSTEPLIAPEPAHSERSAAETTASKPSMTVPTRAPTRSRPRSRPEIFLSSSTEDRRRESYLSLAPSNVSAWSFSSFSERFTLPTLSLSDLSIFNRERETAGERSGTGSPVRWGSEWIGALGGGGGGGRRRARGFSATSGKRVEIHAAKYIEGQKERQQKRGDKSSDEGEKISISKATAEVPQKQPPQAATLATTEKVNQPTSGKSTVTTASAERQRSSSTMKTTNDPKPSTQTPLQGKPNIDLVHERVRMPEPEDFMRGLAARELFSRACARLSMANGVASGAATVTTSDGVSNPTKKVGEGLDLKKGPGKRQDSAAKVQVVTKQEQGAEKKAGEGQDSANELGEVPVVTVGGWMDWFSEDESVDEEDDGGELDIADHRMFDEDGTSLWPGTPLL